MWREGESGRGGTEGERVGAREWVGRERRGRREREREFYRVGERGLERERDSGRERWEWGRERE
jgi:hypothetical protein